MFLYLLCCWSSMQLDFLAPLVVYFFNWLLSFFWLFKEVKCFYLCLHLGQNSLIYFQFMRKIIFFHSNILKNLLYFYKLNHFLLLFKYSCLHFSPPLSPTPPNSTSNPDSFPAWSLSLGPLSMFLDNPSPSFPGYGPLPSPLGNSTAGTIH